MTASLSKRLNDVHTQLLGADNGDSEALHTLMVETVVILRDMAHDIEALKATAQPEPEASHPVANTPEACRNKTCDYFTHYLVHYDRKRQGSRLPHVAYHAASKQCAEAHARYFEWTKAHPNREPPEALEKQCDFWERKVAA